MRKRIWIGLLCLLLLCTTFACGHSVAKDSRPSVVVTIFPQYDFIRQIAGDLVNLTMLVQPGSEVHGYDPTFAEVSTILHADLFVYVGGESDRWVEGVFNKSDHEVNAVSLLSMVDALDEETVEGMQTEEEEDEDARDEHVWTSPKNAIRIVESLRDALIELLPDNAETLSTNAARYIEKLKDLDVKFADLMAHAKHKTVVFAERFPFRYLMHDLGLSYYAALPGCSSNEEVSLSTVAFLIERVREEDLPTVFYIEFSDEKIADAIVSATGCKKLLLHSCHNVSRADFDEGVTYLDLMTRNVESLKEALS